MLFVPSPTQARLASYPFTPKVQPDGRNTLCPYPPFNPSGPFVGRKVE